MRTKRRSTAPSREVAKVTRSLLEELVTNAPPKDREVEAEKRRARAARSVRRGLRGHADRRLRSRSGASMSAEDLRDDLQELLAAGR